MTTTQHLPRATTQESPPAAPSESNHASVIAERRRFPRELPKPDVVELDSDSAWLAFQKPASAEPEGLPQVRTGSGEA